jgi:site-specific DNA recombinase
MPVLGVRAAHVDRAASGDRAAGRPDRAGSGVGVRAGRRRSGVTLATVVSGEDDLSKADGRMVARIKASVDAAEAERIAERTSRAARQRAQQGRPNGGARPFGFLPGGIAHHAREAEALRDATRRIITGDSLRRIMTEWNAAGLTTSMGKR